jgi:hypothetical protein
MFSPKGALLSTGFVYDGVALNLVPSAKFILLAVLAINEPPISNLAFGANTIPFGLIKNRLAVPKCESTHQY